jgi:hypothetical protein
MFVLHVWVIRADCVIRIARTIKGSKTGPLVAESALRQAAYVRGAGRRQTLGIRDT